MSLCLSPSRGSGTTWAEAVCPIPHHSIPPASCPLPRFQKATGSLWMTSSIQVPNVFSSILRALSVPSSTVQRPHLKLLLTSVMLNCTKSCFCVFSLNFYVLHWLPSLISLPRQSYLKVCPFHWTPDWTILKNWRFIHPQSLSDHFAGDDSKISSSSSQDSRGLQVRFPGASSTSPPSE